MKILIRQYTFSVFFVFLCFPLMAQHVIKEEGVQIDEVVVTAKIPPVVIKKDTTIINTSVYKVPEGADLKDLVKRIPGLEYDERSNTLTYNGKYIGEIDVNGEAFFMNNIRIALESLPADFVGRIKVYDKRNEEELATGIDDGIKNYVLDIQTKDEVNNTFLASVQLGGGNKKKKQVDGSLNYFKKGGESFSVLGRSTNESSNTFSRDNMSTSAGTNFMKKLGEKHTLGGDLRYWQGENEKRSSYNMEQYLKEGNRCYSAMDDEKGRNRTFETNLKWQWKINKHLNLNVSGKIHLQNNFSASNNQSATFNSSPMLDPMNPFSNWNDVPDGIKINHGRRKSSSKSDSDDYNGGMGLTYSLNEKGTNVNISMNYADNVRDSERNSDDITTYFQLKNEQGNDSILLRNQYQFSPSFKRSWNSAVSITHPVNKQIRLQFFYKWKSDTKDDEREVYELLDSEKIRIDSLDSNNYEYMDGHEWGTRMNYSSKNWTVNTNFAMMLQQRELKSMMGEQKIDISLHAANYSSSLCVSWGKEKLRTNFNYVFNANQPSLSDLVSLVDHNDPLYITYGNPDLKASYEHRIRWEIEDTKNSLSAYIFWNMDQNRIVRTHVFNAQTGGSISYPVNINGNWLVVANTRWIKRIGKVGLYLQGEGRYDNQVTLINENNMKQLERSVTGRMSLNGRMQWDYVPRWGALISRTSFRFIRSLNTLRDKTTYSRIWICYLEGYVELPGNVQLSTDVEGTFQNGTNVQKKERAEVLWNAKVQWRFLKKKQAELCIFWRNILEKNNNISRYTSAYGLSEFYSQDIRNYVMLTFKYKFRVIK